MSYSEIISAGVSSIEFRGPNEGPVGTNFTQSLSSTAPTLTNISPSVGILTTTLTLTGTNFVSGQTIVTLEGDATASNSVISSTSMTCVVNNDYVDGTQKDVTVANNIINISASTSVTDENYHDTITITLTVESAAAAYVTLSSSASNTITPTWSSPTLTISGTNHADISEHLQNIVIATTSYSSSFTIAVSSSDGTATGTTGTLTCTPGVATTTNGYTQNTPPVWSTAAGSLGTFDEYSTVSITLSVTDPDGSQTLVYSISSGSLPAGLSLSSSGVISGTASNVFSNTTSTFTVNVTDGIDAATRAFSIIVNDLAPSPVFVQETTPAALDHFGGAYHQSGSYGNSWSQLAADGSLVAVKNGSQEGELIIFKTSDNGATWSQQQVLPNNDYDDTMFYGAHITLAGNVVVGGSLSGFASNAIGVITWTTADSGATWTERERLESGTIPTLTLDDSTYRLVVLDYANDDYTFYYSADGTSWTSEQTMTTANGAYGSSHGFDVSGNYFIVKDDDDILAYKRTSGTDPWNLQQTITGLSLSAVSPASISIDGDYFAVKSADDTLKIYKTTDSGASWSLETTITQSGANFHALKMANNPSSGTDQLLAAISESAGNAYDVDAEWITYLYHSTTGSSTWSLAQSHDAGLDGSGAIALTPDQKYLVQGLGRDDTGGANAGAINIYRL